MARYPNFTSPPIVITGAAGMIGSGVVRYLNDAGISDLVLVDDFDGTDKWKNVIGKRFCDILSSKELFPFLEERGGEIGALIHLGACSDTLEKNGAFLLDNNYRYTVRLAEYALNKGKRFIYASSAATYGDGSKGFSDDHEGLLGLVPMNPYGFSKHLFDLWAHKAGVLDRIVGLKYFNVFGPNENHKGHMASMVYKMVPSVQKEGVLRLFRSSDPDRYEDGESCRDFIYVKDAVAATCEFLTNELMGIYNIGLGTTCTWNALARSVFDALEMPVRIEYVPMPEDLKKQYQNYTCADMNKWHTERTKKGLPPLFRYSVSQGVFDYIRNYLLPEARW